MKIEQQAFFLAIAVVSIFETTAATTTMTTRVPDVENPTPMGRMAQVSPSFIERTWEVEDNKMRVQFYKSNNVYNGKIIWLPSGAESRDVKNPNQNLRSRSLIGLVVFKGFTYNPGIQQWTGGSAYIPDLGKTLKPKFSIGGEGKLKMQVSMGVLSKTVTLNPL